jgi:polysaccharide biosynthesis/export protein
MSLVNTASRFIVTLCVVGSVACSTLPYANDGKPVSILVTPGNSDSDLRYRLQVGDVIGMHFLAYPDLDDTTTIGPDGHVSMRLIPDFQMAGLTLVEAAKATNDRYESVLRHPGVSLTIRSYSLQQIYVSGEVNNPGVLRSNTPLTASAAIAQAGGMKLATAHPRDALLLRRRSDGSIAYYKLDFHADLPSHAGDPLLKNNDVIYVPRTVMGSVSDWVQANIQRIVPVNGSVYYNLK